MKPKRVRRKVVESSNTRHPWQFYLVLECGHTAHWKTYTLRHPKTVTCQACSEEASKNRQGELEDGPE